ncbi:hypothetical protein Bca52824_065517 [Brassica carinata]|uniref:RRM domain-containing protein n=1 Tax=Brassica carinata TaxID=52824 RepID=A0A8X7U9Q5_BRACI|nr:hypothetical protein Bca52824_065517 [Brassica carinata]
MSLHVTQTDIKLFFEAACGEVYRLRLLGDYHHPTRISFVEFVMAESAVTTLNCSGVLLGSLQISLMMLLLSFALRRTKEYAFKMLDILRGQPDAGSSLFHNQKI